MLASQTNKLGYFLNDIIEGIKAPQGFVTKVMVSLESSLYDVGDTIIKAGDSVENLVFIISGSCDLNGFHTVPAFNSARYERLRPGFYDRPTYKQVAETEDEMEEFKIKVVTLRPGAWFGDYQIMVNVKSSWELQASKGSQGQGVVGRISSEKVQVFELAKDRAEVIYNLYPEYRRFHFLRASLRRTHWLKVFEENRHQWLLQKKIEEQKLVN